MLWWFLRKGNLIFHAVRIRQARSCLWQYSSIVWIYGGKLNEVVAKHVTEYRVYQCHLIPQAAIGSNEFNPSDCTYTSEYPHKSKYYSSSSYKK